MNDQRLDQLIRASLEWQAESSAAAQPTLRDASRRLAKRLWTPKRALRPPVTMRPAAMSWSQLAVMVLLLILLIGTVVLVGSELIRRPPPAPPGPFGFARDCELPPALGGLAFDEPGNEAVLILATGPEPTLITLYEDGRLVRDLSQPGETRQSTISGARIAQRVLTRDAVQQVSERLEEAGLSPGCRALAADTLDGGNLMFWTEAGVSDTSWGPGPPMGATYQLTDEAEDLLEQVLAEIEAPEAWLPPDAFVEPAERQLRPHHYLLQVTVRPVEAPADQLLLPDGTPVEGVDPRLELLNLPGNQDAATLGEELHVEGPGARSSIIRCLAIGVEQAEELARSQEVIDMGIGTGADGDGDGEFESEFYSATLEGTISLGLQPVYGSEYSCADLAQDGSVLSAPGPTGSPAPVAGDLARVDPCSTVPAGAEVLVKADARQVGRSSLPIGVAAQTCLFFDSSVPPESVEGMVYPLPAGYRAGVTLYPARLDADEAQQVIGWTLGGELSMETIGSQQVWATTCPEPVEFGGCTEILAVFVRDRLLFFEFTGAGELVQQDPEDEWSTVLVPHISPEAARLFVEEVVSRD